MKKKELEEVAEAVNGIKVLTNNLRLDVINMVTEYRKTNDSHKKLLEDVNNANKIIDTLITQNFVDDPTYAAVVLIPYRGKPTFIKDGKRIAKNFSEVTITWNAYERSVRFSTENM